MPRDIETMPPLEAQYAVEPPKPPLHQPWEENRIMRPPTPPAIMALAQLRARKNEALRLVSIWKSQSSSVTSSIELRRRKHGGQVRQRVQVAEFVDRPVHQRALSVQVGQVAAGGDMAIALHACHNLVHGLLTQVDRHHPGTRRGEHLSGRPPDTAPGTGHDHALALQARSQIPSHVFLLVFDETIPDAGPGE